MHGVSCTALEGVASLGTLSGNERRHCVQVRTTCGMPFESFPLRGIHIGAASESCAITLESLCFLHLVDEETRCRPSCPSRILGFDSYRRPQRETTTPHFLIRLRTCAPQCWPRSLLATNF